MKKIQGSVVRHADDIQRRIVGAGTATEMQELLSREDGTRRFIMGRGGGD